MAKPFRNAIFGMEKNISHIKDSFKMIEDVVRPVYEEVEQTDHITDEYIIYKFNLASFFTNEKILFIATKLNEHLVLPTTALIQQIEMLIMQNFIELIIKIK